ncbi:MAG: TIGR03790 family protein [Akkermansiaceae bacterium]
MNLFARVLLLLAVILPSAGAAISPEAVAVLYNSAVPESRQLAEQYRAARGIPPENLIALEMPTAADISRDDYEQTILKPLRAEFERRVWWQRRTDAAGITLPVINQIKVLVTLRGVPLRIKSTHAAGAPVDPKDPISGRDEASVDSELVMFGAEGLPVNGVLPNKFHLSEKSISDAGLPFMVLVARIDAPRFATCQRMIRDAVETEETGLWGRAYVDIANKFPQGDQWLEDVVKANGSAGITTVVDRFDETLPAHYPMTDASLYYGWYDWNVGGPFLNHRFQFRRGAVAMHLHSFSAEQLSNPSKNWSGALLERGAAVTVGNVYEPYLHLTHDYGILHQRLLAGFTWVEACWMSIPVSSWQAVVLGDPLYRPFHHLDGGGVKQDGDIEFRALRAAAVEWKNDPRERQKQLENASERMKSGILAEAAGLDLLHRGNAAGAAPWFRAAKVNFAKTDDQLRQDFHLIGMDRAAGLKELAIAGLREAQRHYGPISEAEALAAWLKILDPPPPPPPAPAAPAP